MKYLLLLLLPCCKSSLISIEVPSGGKSIIHEVSKYEKKEKKEEVLTDDGINDWLKQEFINIISNPYPQ